MVMFFPEREREILDVIERVVKRDPRVCDLCLDFLYLKCLTSIFVSKTMASFHVMFRLMQNVN